LYRAIKSYTHIKCLILGTVALHISISLALPLMSNGYVLVDGIDLAFSLGLA